MKKYLFILFISLSLFSTGQSIENSQVLLDNAKILFKKNELERKENDYTKVITLLKQVIKLDTTNAEAKYFLGYTYSRLNSLDGRGINGMELGLLLKTSKQFEEVIKLTPVYSGEKVIIGPYSKLTAEWGSMALKYWHQNNLDSAVWALKEGKKRGGFSDYSLKLAQKSLDECSKNAILISSGDVVTFTLFYNQLINNYRKDVSIIDISLLNTIWYPNSLYKKKIIDFGIPKEKLDRIDYKVFASDSTYRIKKHPTPYINPTMYAGNFSWKLKTSDYYVTDSNVELFAMTRSEQIFLNIIKKNLYSRAVYFTFGNSTESLLGLDKHSYYKVLVNQIIIEKNKKINLQELEKTISDISELSKFVNPNNSGDVFLYNVIFRGFLQEIVTLLEMDLKSPAKDFIKVLEKNYFHNQSSFIDPSLKKSYHEINQYINE